MTNGNNRLAGLPSGNGAPRPLSLGNMAGPSGHMALNGHGQMGAGVTDLITSITGAAQSAAAAVPQVQAQVQTAADRLEQAVKAQLVLSAVTAVGTIILVVLALKDRK